MLVIKIWNYFRGYVIIRIEGLTLEKFLNLAISKDIYLWDVNRINHSLIEAKVSVEGFKLLKEVVRKVGCRVHIIEKKGYPFFIDKFKHRKMLGFGFLIFISLLIFLSSFIWDIEILGNKKIEDEKIFNVLKDMNVKKGVIKYKVKTDEIKHKLLEDLDIISFASVEIKGTKLSIEIKEQDLVPMQKVNEHTPCNIIAKKKGVIEKVIARNGKKVVEKGDVVKKGQILISGLIKDEMLDEDMFVHSDGEAFALTRYVQTVQEPIEKIIKQQTGKVYNVKEFKIGEKGIRFVKGKIPFENYVEELKEKKLIKFSKLPVSIVTHEYKEVKLKKIKQNVDFLKKSSQIKAIEEINKRLPKNSKTISKDVKYFTENDKLITQVVVEVIEDIGEKQILNNRED